MLSNLGLDLDQIRQAVESMVAQTGGTLTIGEIPFTSNAKRVLELSVEEARQLGHNYVGTEHLLLGLIREGEGVAAKVLSEMGVDRKKVRDETLKLLGGHPQQQQAESEEKADTPSLNQFGRDLTQLARESKLDPIFGRESEIERVVQILCRRKKNNPILIGEPGVGRPRSPRAWPSGSSKARCRSSSAAIASSRSTWPRSWPGRSTAVSSKSGSRTS